MHRAVRYVKGQRQWVLDQRFVRLERSGQVAAIHRGLREVIRLESVGRAPTRILAFRTPVPYGAAEEKA